MTTATLQVAKTILSQIGGGALYMIGAKNKIAVDEQRGGVQFRTGRTAAGKANFVQIVLTGADLYNIVFKRIHGMSIKAVAEYKGMFADQMNELIERETGLYTSL